MSLDPQFIDRLVKLLGMLSSAHDGERANAGAMADKLVRGHGLTWTDVIGSVVSERAGSRKSDTDDLNWRVMHRFCLDHRGALRGRELEFITSLSDWRGSLTRKQ